MLLTDPLFLWKWSFVIEKNIVIDMVIAINIGLGRVGIVPTATIGHLLQ